MENELSGHANDDFSSFFSFSSPWSERLSPVNTELLQSVFEENSKSKAKRRIGKKKTVLKI